MWFAISSTPPICYPSFNFIGGVVKSTYLNLDVKNIFVGHILSTAGDALRCPTSNFINGPKSELSQFISHARLQKGRFGGNPALWARNVV
jgi:hypothetical protein